jgi:hypothetical protein
VRDLAHLANRRHNFYDARARGGRGMARGVAVKNDEGGEDLIIHNMVDSVIGTLTGIGTGSGSTSRMVIKNYDASFSSRGANAFYSGLNAATTPTGDLGMLFRDFNPAYALAALAPFVQGVPIAQSLMAALGGLVLGDAAAWTGAAAARLAKGLAWAAGADPLVIDLDASRARASGGCVRAAAGIETRDAWRAAAFILATVERAANDDENGACNVGNRRVEWAIESVLGIAA